MKRPATRRCALTALTGAALALLGPQAELRAQAQVTGITYGDTINRADTKSGGITFRNEYRPVTNIMTTGGGYQFNGPVAQDVYFRRTSGTGSPNNATVFHQVDSSGKAYGTYEPNLEEMFLSSNLYEGLRNPFANGSTSLDSNIERIDFYLPNYTVQAGDGLVFFDLENAGHRGDGFRIAAITEWTPWLNLPTAYANTGRLIEAGSFGPEVDSPGDNASRDYARATYTSGNNLNGSASVADLQEDLGLVGILIKFTDLGIAAGTTIQGFSIMAGDVTPTTASSLVDWTNSKVYRTNTDRNTWGNMDFMAFGAQVSRPIPEPSTYGAMFVGGVVAWCFWRRRRTAGLRPR